MEGVPVYVAKSMPDQPIEGNFALKMRTRSDYRYSGCFLPEMGVFAEQNANQSRTIFHIANSKVLHNEKWPLCMGTLMVETDLFLKMAKENCKLHDWSLPLKPF